MVDLGELQQIVPKGIQQLSEYGTVDGDSLAITADDNNVFYLELVMQTHKEVPRPFNVDGLLFVIHETISPSESDNLPVKI